MTVEWFSFLNSLKEEIKNDWTNSAFVGASADETLQRNAAAIGAADLLKRLMEASFVEIEETIYDNK
jgi:hypothetical protein